MLLADLGDGPTQSVVGRVPPARSATTRSLMDSLSIVSSRYLWYGSVAVGSSTWLNGRVIVLRRDHGMQPTTSWRP